MLLRCVSTTSTRIFSIRMFKVNILHFWSCKIGNYYKNCRIRNILVEFVPEGYIYEIKLVAFVLKDISSNYSPTNEIWALLLRGQSKVDMDIFLWNVSFYQDMLPYIHIVCKPHSHIPYRCLTIFWEPVYLG